MIYKMMTERETISFLNEDGLFKGTHIAYYSAGTHTHMQMQPNQEHSHTHTTFSMQQCIDNPCKCVFEGLSHVQALVDHMKIY